MTAQKLVEILEFLDALDQRLTLQKKLESVNDALSVVVSSPAQPQYQADLATTLAELKVAAEGLRGSITPSQYSEVEGMGGADFFDPNIVNRVNESIQTNAMTPSVAADFVAVLTTARSKFLSTVRSARKNLEQLGISVSAPKPGSADLAFLIPRDMFGNELAEFAKELKFISSLLKDVSEALTGHTEPVQLEQLSSSVPTVALIASAEVIKVIAEVVSKFLEMWEKIKRLRRLKAELEDEGISDSALEQMTERIDTTVEEEVEEATQLILLKYPGSPTRKNELGNALRQNTHRLFAQIERGLQVEFRAEPPKDGKAEDQRAFADISEIARTLKFPQVAHQPMLLKDGAILEGEIQTVRRSKKTTTHKSTVRKTVAPKDSSVAELKD